jgi:hypothetical protein
VKHDCRARLCDTPHNDLDSHPGECGCSGCHEFHDWTEWAIWPECDYCVEDMMAWLAENTDYFELQRTYGRAA